MFHHTVFGAIDSPLFYMVPPRRFERLTYGLGIRCSIQLSYGGLFIFNKLQGYRISSFF